MATPDAVDRLIPVIAFSLYSFSCHLACEGTRATKNDKVTTCHWLGARFKTLDLNVRIYLNRLRYSSSMLFAKGAWRSSFCHFLPEIGIRPPCTKGCRYLRTGEKSAVVQEGGGGQCRSGKRQGGGHEVVYCGFFPKSVRPVLVLLSPVRMILGK